MVMVGEKIFERAVANESGGVESSSSVGMGGTSASASFQSEKSYVGSSMKLSRFVCKSIRLAGLFSRR